MSFSMNVVNQEEVKTQIKEQVTPALDEMAQLQIIAEEKVQKIMNIDIQATNLYEKKEQVLKMVEELGEDTMKSSSQKNSMLKVSVGALAKMGDEGGDVAKSLTVLHRQVKDLDPSGIDFAKKGFLGLFSPVRAYFEKYKKADAIIADLVKSLENGQRVLRNDNTTLGSEQDNLRALTKQLKKDIEVNLMIDRSIDQQVRIAEDQQEDPEKIKFITEEVLVPLRQRVLDQQQLLVVNQQGIMALELVIRNNKELIRGADRAQKVTVVALQNAVMVARALYKQKLVLDNINTLNQVTNDVIKGTAIMLKTQSADIQKQALEPNISVDTLRQSFADVIEAMDSISAYKQAALPRMRETIEQFKELADKGHKEIMRLENGSQVEF